MRIFEENQKRIANNYNQTVANIKSEKESSEIIRQMKDQQEIQRRIEQQEQQDIINKRTTK